jgi:hypothetical protein
MSSERFLNSLFNKLKESDFSINRVLTTFYQFYKKEKTNMLKCYIDYITRNQVFVSNKDSNEYLLKLYDSLKEAILNGKELNKDFIINKEHTMIVLSNFIDNSYIITYENPNELSNQDDQDYRENVTNIMLDEIQNLDKRILPIAKKDEKFSEQLELLSIWQETENKCNNLKLESSLYKILNKAYYIDSSLVKNKPQYITTVIDSKINDKLPFQTLTSKYTNLSYNLDLKLVNFDPLFTTKSLSKTKKTIYICAGSQMVLGGNADQGLNVSELSLYMNSTYSIPLENALHAYPLSLNNVILCPVVLIFNDVNYKLLPNNEFQSISVLNSPSKWRPNLNNLDLTELELDHSEINELYKMPKTTFANKIDLENCITHINNSIELALFFGYNNIVFDDLAISDNYLPAYQIAKILKTTIMQFKSRLDTVIVSIKSSENYNIFKTIFDQLDKKNE